MKVFVINHTQISVDLISVCFWIVIADKHLQFLRTKHFQYEYEHWQCQNGPEL